MFGSLHSFISFGLLIAACRSLTIFQSSQKVSGYVTSRVTLVSKRLRYYNSHVSPSSISRDLFIVLFQGDCFDEWSIQGAVCWPRPSLIVLRQMSVHGSLLGAVIRWDLLCNMAANVSSSDVCFVLSWILITLSYAYVKRRVTTRTRPA